MENKMDLPEGILILDDYKAISSKWEKEYNNLNEDVKIYNLTEVKKLPIKFDSNPKINNIYFRHPFFNDHYFPITTDKHEIQRLKLGNISHLCGILGAKSFRSVQINTQEKEFAYNAELKVSGPVSGLEAKIASDRQQKHEIYYEILNEYEGQSYPDFEGAKVFAKKTGLINDKSILQLIEKRNPVYKNILTKHKINVNLSSEINKALDISASLNAFAGRLQINTNYNQKSMEREVIQLEILVEF